YFELATDMTPAKLQEIKKSLESPDINPMDIKQELGETLVDMYHPAGSGRQAREEFERIFKKRQLPDEVPEMGPKRLCELGFDLDKIYLVHLICKTGLSKSNGEARKLITAGAVSIDGEKVSDPDVEIRLDREMVLKVGKRRFLRLLPS
ncbi:MAG: tyrosine--tRNA ligase, partial [candidate division Zixibacteria bacterium]|nr:tyrosine--tRNA ligase [candidate division Zixibacteria bacterium]